MKYVDIDSWARKEQYLFFKEYENPFFNICTTVNIANLQSYVKEHSIPLSRGYLYLSLKAVNEVEEMRYRIHEDKVVVYPRIDAGWIMMKENGSIRFCYLEYTNDFRTFCQQMQETAEI